MELWIPVKGYEGRYEVSSMGRVKSLVGKCFLKPGIVTNFYPTVVLYRNSEKTTHKIHRLVLEAFIARPRGKRYTNHRNGNKTDNRLMNLEWCTQSENCLHAYRTGLKKQGNPTGINQWTKRRQ